MTNDHGPNVLRLNYHGGSRLSQQPDGSWVAFPVAGPESEEDWSRGATPEEAAGARIAKLEAEGEYLPEPPADYGR